MKRGRGRTARGGRGSEKQRTTVSRPARLSGIMGVTPRMNGIKLHTEFNLVAANATLVNPFTYAYLNLTNPQLSNGGSATAVPFFGMYTAGYRKYRVNNYHVRLRYANSEAFIVAAFTCPFNYQPPNTLSSNTAAYQDVLTKHALLSSKGGMDNKTISFSGSVASMAGFANRGIEDPYVGLTDGTSPPSDNIYTLISCGTGGPASVTGVFIEVAIDFVIDFEERQTPASLRLVMSAETLKLDITDALDVLGARDGRKEDMDAVQRLVYEQETLALETTLSGMKRRLWELLGGELSWVKRRVGEVTVGRDLVKILPYS